MTSTQKEQILTKANAMCKNTLMEAFQIKFIEAGDDYLIAQMPVNEATCQPDGILHGGASAALAETVGSMAAIVFSADNQSVRGIDVFLNHVRGALKGSVVYAKAQGLHLGKTLQHWDIKITDENEKLIAYGKHTTITISKK